MANFTELDRYLFGQATHYDIYKKLGAHVAERKGKKVSVLMCGRQMRQESGLSETLTTGARQQMRWNVLNRSQWEFLSFLFRRSNREICISTLLRQKMEDASIRQTHMQIMQN